MPLTDNHRGCAQEQSEQQQVMASWIGSIMKVGCPLVSGRMWLACLNNSAVWWGSKTHYSGFSKHSAWYPRQRVLSLEAEWGKELAVRSFKALLVLPAVKAAHILNLNFMPYTTTIHGTPFCLFFWLHGILVPWPGVEPGPPEVEMWSPNHWTTRDFLFFFLILSS